MGERDDSTEDFQCVSGIQYFEYDRKEIIIIKKIQARNLWARRYKAAFSPCTAPLTKVSVQSVTWPQQSTKM